MEEENEIISKELKEHVKQLIVLLYADQLTDKGKRELDGHIQNMWVAYEGNTRLLHEVKEMYDEECDKVKKLEHEIWHKGKQIDYLIDLLQQEGYLQFDLKQQVLDYIDKLLKLEDKE